MSETTDLPSLPAIPKRRPALGRIALGAFLLLAGLWLLLDQWGLHLPGLSALWPLVLIGGGGLFLSSWWLEGQGSQGALWLGVSSLLTGLFFFSFTSGLVDWWRLGELWPLLLMIGGFAFFANWLAGGADGVALLVPAVLGLSLGAMGLAATLGWYTDWIFPALDIGWPLVLMVGGGLLIWRGVQRSRA